MKRRKLQKLSEERKMSFLSGKTGEVQLVWRLLLILVLFVLVAVLLRFIPIVLYTWLLAGSGVDRQDALATARSVVFEDPVWSTILGILTGLLSLPLVWFLIGVIEKRRFEWKMVGLDWRHNSPSSLALGGLLALLICVANELVDSLLGSPFPSVTLILGGLSVPGVAQKLALYLPAGFGEEVVFRGYVQTRLVERHGAFWGILLASTVFNLLHLPFYSLSSASILTGVLLWGWVGALYHWKKSLYLVGMFHGTSNVLLNTLPLEATEAGGLIVHSLAFFLVVALLRR